MAGRRGTTVSSPSTSARLRFPSSTREEGGLFHSLPNIRLAPREATKSASDAQRAIAANGNAGTRPEVSTTASTKATASQDAPAGHPQIPQESERSRRRLSVGVHSHHGTVEVGTRTCGTDSTRSQLATLAPSSKSRPVVANIPGKTFNDRCTKCKSKAAKVANLKTSLRLVPQQLVFTPIGAVPVGVKCRNSLGHSVNEGSRRASSRYPESEKDSSQVHTTQWIDKGPVVSPMYAIVLQSSLRPLKNTLFGDTQMQGEYTPRGYDTSCCSPAAKTSALDRNRKSGSSSKAKGRGSWLMARHVHLLPLLITLSAIAIFCVLGLYAVRKDSPIAYTTGFGADFSHEREYITVPPQGDVSTGVRVRRRLQIKRGQPVDNDPDAVVRRSSRAFENIIQEPEDNDNTTVNERYYTTF